MTAATTNPPRRFQFRIWHLLWCMTVVGVCLALVRLDIFGGMIVFVGSELVVVVMGTGLYVLNGPIGWRTRLTRGILAGSSTAGLCFGWIPLMMSVSLQDPRLLLGLLGVIAAGAVLGLIIGLVMPAMALWYCRRMAPQPTTIRQPDRSRHRALERATDRVLRVVLAARRCAAEHRHDFITPEHLLWALGTVDRGVAHAVLETLGVDVSQQTKRLAPLIAAAPPGGGQHSPTFSPELGRVLDLAHAQAVTTADVHLQSKCVYLGTEDLVLGILARGDTPAAKFLEKQGVTLERFRHELLKLLGCK